MQQMALIIDHYACYGCLACEVACKQENGSDYGVKLIELREDGPRMMNGKLDFVFNVNACVHAACDGTPCIDICPVGIIYSTDEGIVVMDSDNCVGCNICELECPIDAIRMNYGLNVTEKCNLCHHRVAEGLMPACADNICLAHCIYFGDPVDIEKQIAAKRATAMR